MIRRRTVAATAVGCIVGLLVPLFWSAFGVRAQENPAKLECQLFEQTGYKLCGRFLQYWRQHGGLAQHGYPISDPVGELSAVDGRLYTVQYFERAVFELHPENQPPHDVLLSLLGAFRYAAKYPEGAPGQQPNTSPGARPFEQTGHTVGGGFLQYWEAYGGLDRFGYPLSDEFTELSDLDGQAYVVQYFERAVLEYHPENAPEGRILLSQLGTFRSRDLSITLTWVPAPVPVPPALEEHQQSPPEVAPPAATLDQRIDRYVSKLTLAQQIGQLIMIPVFAGAYGPVYDTFLQQYQIANAIIFTTGGGSVRPATLDGLRTLTSALAAHSPNPMLIAMD